MQGKILSSQVFLGNLSGQVVFEVAAGMHAVLNDKEGVGIQLVQYFLHRADLIFAQADAQHAHTVAGVCTGTLPVGNAAVKAIHNGSGQGVGLFLGKKDHLRGNVLLMQTVNEQGTEYRIDRGIYRYRQAENQRANAVKQRIVNDGEFPHGALSPFAV